MSDFSDMNKKEGKFDFRVDEQLLSDCKAIAKANGTRLSKETRRFLESYRNRHMKDFNRLDSGKLIKVK